MIEFSTAFGLLFGFSLFTGIVGFYLGERGWSGVQNDLNNVKLDVAHLKGSISGIKPPSAPVSVPALTLPKSTTA